MKLSQYEDNFEFTQLCYLDFARVAGFEVPRLDPVPNKEQYLALQNEWVILGFHLVRVESYTKHGRSGSYERGFKFSDTTYGMLYSAGKYSADHGKTWRYVDYLAFKDAARKDRIRLSTDQTKEFAFEAIQRLNRKYEGPGYKWRP